jgi:hypothetical protein
LGDPLQQKLHPKCANPACATAFHALGGGKFFRFDVEAAGDASGKERIAPPGAGDRARHYWLCEQCSSVLRLSYDADRGVVFGLRWPELPGEAAGNMAAHDPEAESLEGFPAAVGETRA